MFADYNSIEVFYLVCAMVGGIFVGLKTAMMFLGGDTDLDADGGDIDLEHADSDAGFRMLTTHGITSFLMMFGLVGLAMYRGSQLGVILSLGGAVFAGLITMWLMAKLFFWATRLQSSGTIDIIEVIGCTGTVYLTIPQGGTGTINVSVNNRRREYEAKEKNGVELPTGTPIRVVHTDQKILVVETL